MSTTGHVRVELDMTFPIAGVGFRVQVGPGDGTGTEGTTLLIGLRALEAGKTVRFTLESSRPLGDFIGGFCRWLGTKGVQVSHTDEEISGHFHPRYTVLQMLETLQDLCEMLNDKFAGYPESIVS